ncbi:hypothetical protein [Flagellimonas onchidii]|uniref:hypothetical protein n=1 Tax=Flagellimonas onchidii TaxID=2562684 RepID=UPI0010A63892|nr:hypothetical protein [Allomuricauda onchidii]
MRKLILLSFLGLLISCELFTSKEEQTKNRVNEELLAIDWNDVDQYPLFEGCDETAPKEIQRECFQTRMLQIAADTLDSLSFEVENDMEDTLYIDFKVDEHGFISIVEIEEKQVILNEIANFNEQISERLADLTVAPALKRGMPVSLRFRLPLILNTN